MKANSVRTLIALAALPTLLLFCGCDEDETPTTTDTRAPAAVEDLTAEALSPSVVELTWTAPGDDSTDGTAATYDLRFRDQAITPASWDSLTVLTGLPEPQPAGNDESFTVTDLTEETDYFFALRTADEAENWSAISNIASATTPRAPAVLWVNPDGTGDFITIQEAIDAAAEEDTIRVVAGIYEELLTIGNRTLIMIGAGPEETIVHYGDVPDFNDLVFISHSDVQIFDMRFSCDYIGCPNAFVCDDATLTLDGCALIECGLTVSASDFVMRGCTVYSHPDYSCEVLVPLVLLIGGTAEIEHNIIVRSVHYGVSCAGPEVSFRCNDCYEHGHANYGACPDPTGTMGNISANPLFVDPEGDDFRLQPDSPCIGGASDCNRMGAFEVAE